MADDAKTQGQASSDENTDTDKDNGPKLAEKEPIRTRHEITVGGKTLSYHATVGMMPMKNDKGEIEAEMFFMAYTLDTPEGSGGSRPLTFAFNGGPGSSSIWLHMGALGPKRVHLNPDGTAPPPPFRVVDNEQTWLAETDLVFIDPIGTGFSRAAKDEFNEKYWGYTGDIESVGEFIRLYLSRYNRWTSPLFLAGESYGTIRATGLAGHLIDKGIAFNGIILVSALLNYQTLFHSTRPGDDIAYCVYVPGYTATAWYHERLPDDLQARPLADVLAEVEEWTRNEYVVALMKGDLLTDDERATTIRQLARYTGLSEDYVDRSELRIGIMRFCKELLRDEKTTVGRLDSRFRGLDVLAVSDTPDYDPSMVQPTPPFTAAFNDYVRTELGYGTDTEYESLNFKVNQKWKFDQERTGFVQTAEAIRKAFLRSPYLKILVTCGYYDLATPYSAVTYTFNHMGLGGKMRDAVRYTYYESGHMMYIDAEEREKFTADCLGFLRESVSQ